MLLGLSPLPVTVTTRIITSLVGDPYKPSFATVTGRGDNPTCCTQYVTAYHLAWSAWKDPESSLTRLDSNVNKTLKVSYTAVITGHYMILTQTSSTKISGKSLKITIHFPLFDVPKMGNLITPCYTIETSKNHPPGSPKKKTCSVTKEPHWLQTVPPLRPRSCG